MALRSISSLLSGVLVLGFLSCADIPRDNPLDPRNPDSQSDRRMLIEAFVNTQNGFTYNEIMIDALDSLARRFPDIEIVQYHRNTRQAADSLHLNESEIRYQSYLSAIGAELKGVPDVFFNGIHQRVQGASTLGSALFRLEQAYYQESGEVSLFLMETRLRGEGSALIPEVTLARLGKTSTTRLLVKALLIGDTGHPEQRHVVMAVSRGTVIDQLRAGEQKTMELPPLLLGNALRYRVVFVVTDEAELNIFQCASEE